MFRDRPKTCGNIIKNMLTAVTINFIKSSLFLEFVFCVSDPFLSCDFVTSSHCSGFCNFFYVARVLVLLNTFVSLCLIGLFLNKIGVKQWVNGAGSLHCLFFATLQIFLTFATCLFLFYLFFHVRNVKAGLDERYVVSGFDATVGWCFMFPIGSFVLSLFVICVPAKEVFSKVSSF